MTTKLTRIFTDSAAALLAAFATALLLGNVAAKLVQPLDPVFALPMDRLFWILGAITWVVLLAIVFLRSPCGKLGLILWFAANLAIYRLSLLWLGFHTSGYLGSLAHTFDLSGGATDKLLNLLFLYLLIGSAVLLLWQLLARPEEVPGKAICAHCGGHIAFSRRNLGQKIPCPHCQAGIILRGPEFLKTACFFCQQHIEFPAHAIGGRISCPHCKMEITLKEPAQ